MKIGMSDSGVFIRDLSESQHEAVASWGGLFRFSRKTGWWGSSISEESLSHLATLGTLPQEEQDELERLIGIREKLDRERTAPAHEPLVPYPVKRKPFQHQIQGANMALIAFGAMSGKPAHRGFAYLFEMGTGKSLTAIMTIGALRQMGLVKSLLIVAPASVCSVWPQEFEESADFTYQIAVLEGEKKKRLNALTDLQKAPEDDLKVAVINYESVWREDIFEAIKKWNPDMIVADESQRIKSPQAKQSKAMWELGDLARYKLALSGTPVTNSAMDLFSQYRFMDRSIFGNNFYSFRNRYAIMGGFDRKQVVGLKNEEDLIRREYSQALRVTKAEALDLPEQIFTEMPITMTPKQAACYKKLARDSYAELANGGIVTATTVLTKLLRLQQLTGGFLQEDEKTAPTFVGSPKLDAVDDFLQDHIVGSDRKAVIFARFVPEIKEICRHIEKYGIQYVCIFGEVKMSDRGEMIKRFQEDPSVKVAVLQLDCAGTGITLTAADVCIYYSLNFNYSSFVQSTARIHRIGQKNSCTYIELVCKGTVDEKILKALKNKQNLAKTVVDDWRQYFC